MKRLIILATLAAMAATPALAWERDKTVTTGRGTHSRTASGSCSDGTCTRTGTATGPRGNSVTSSGSASCANGTCTRSSTVTTPNGKTVTSSGSVTTSSGQ